jgi:hypothetical protein
VDVQRCSALQPAVPLTWMVMLRRPLSEIGREFSWQA